MRILLLDIETAPTLAMVWGLFKQNVALDQIQKPGYTLCWSAKWLGSKETEFGSLKQDGLRRMLRRVHKLIDEADALVTYNGTTFDLPTLNAEFLKLGMKPPSPVKHIDLLQTTKKEFRLVSRKLDFVAKMLGVGQKVKHKGMALWIGCMANDAESWGLMEEYNRQDVHLLEHVYHKLLPWIKSHPNHGVYSPSSVPQCPNCGSADLQRRGMARTQVNAYYRFQCKGCGTWTREGYSELNTEDRRKILRPVMS
jgi:predicted RNA-binding Zn-ribbon protein involved in translation (DUF1610 family)